MEYVVENSRLAPEDLRDLLPSSIEKISKETDERGLATDLLIAIVDGAANAVVAATLTAIWLAYKRRRERDHQETRSSAVWIQATGDHGTRIETLLNFHSDGTDAVRDFESKVEIERNGTAVVQRIRVIFPEGS